MKAKWIRYNRQKFFLGLFLILIIAGIGIGYALVSTKLSIDGIVTLRRDSNWSVHLDNFQAMQGSVAPLSTPTVTDTNVTFSAKVTDPGDFYGFTVDIVNDGNLNADIGELSITPDFSEIPYGTITVVYADDDTPVALGDIIPYGKTRTIKVVVNYETDSFTYPASNQSFNVNISLGYEQYTDVINYTVTLVPNGSWASVDPSTLQRAQGSAAMGLPIPERSGYTFIGWYTEATGGTLITDETIINDNVKYYAHWQQ